MRAAPPTLPADTPASRIHQDQDQLANARVAEADTPSHHYNNRSKPRKLLAIQQGGGHRHRLGFKGTRYMTAIQTILQKARYTDVVP
jgi:hypothetical protein